MDRNPYIPLAKVRHCVALRKESVDRNWAFRTRSAPGKSSLSARRAWIEMFAVFAASLAAVVALRKESVDRNKMSKIAGMYEVGRSPQGERG